MFIRFLCFCPLRLAIMLNFNISKVAYCHVDNAIHLFNNWGLESNLLTSASDAVNAYYESQLKNTFGE